MWEAEKKEHILVRGNSMGQIMEQDGMTLSSYKNIVTMQESKLEIYSGANASES